MPDDPPSQHEPPSILVLTKDEEANIGPCLERLAFSDDVVVLDSGSTDRTVEIAESHPGVRVIQRPFDTEHLQRNFGLHEIEYRHPWLYICDADERVPDELAEEMLRRVNDPANTHAAFRLRYRNMFMGRWIRFASAYPVWLIRLVQPSRVRYEQRATNVHPIVDGTVGRLDRHFVHYSFRSGLRRWFGKHNYYSEREAIEAVAVRTGGGGPRLSELFSRDPIRRRRALKNFSFRLWGRPFWRFFYQAVVRLGFLDGMAGLRYAAMVAVYEYWIEVKMRELEQDWSGRTRRLADARLDDPRPPADTSDIGVMIPTLNEADHIADTVANARQLGPVFVLDSCSTDGTQQLAEQAGATVIEHAFEDYSKQKNWGLANLPFDCKWVLILDADERVTPALRDELMALAAGGAEADGYYINRQLFLMGRQIKHGGMYPSWNLRFFKRGSCRYEKRRVHEHMLCDGPTAYARHALLHIRDESLSRFIQKHIRYAQMEADEWRAGLGESAQRLFPGRLGLRLWLRRVVWPKLPGRPLWRFLYMYVVRLGCLDGAGGWHMAMLMASYEYMIALFHKEARAQARDEARSKQSGSTETTPKPEGTSDRS